MVRMPRMLGAVLLCAAVLLQACSSEQNTPGPPRAVNLRSLPPQLSTVAIPVQLDLQATTQLLNERVPVRIADVDEKRDSCLRVRSVRMSCHLQGHADRGEIALSMAGEELLLHMPVAATLTVRGSGSLGKHLRETAHAEIDAHARIQLEVDEQWQLQVQVIPDFSWRERAHVEVAGLRIDIARQVEPALRKVLQRVGETATTRMAELPLRKVVQTLWDRSGTPLQLRSEPPVWLQFQPASLGMRLGSTADAGDARRRTLTLNLQASGQTQVLVGAAPAMLQPTALPPPQRDTAPPHLSLLLPVLLDYDWATQALQHWLKVGSAQQIDVPRAGPMEVTVLHATVYPTLGDRLAIGLSLSIRQPGAWSRTRGQIWLTGDLVVDRQLHTLRVGTLDLAVHSDHPVTHLLLEVAQTPMIRQQLTAALRYDFSRLREHAVQQTREALNRSPAAGVQLQGDIQHASVEEIRVSANGLYVGLKVEGALQVQVDAREYLQHRQTSP